MLGTTEKLICYFQLKSTTYVHGIQYKCKLVSFSYPTFYINGILNSVYKIQISIICQYFSQLGVWHGMCLCIESMFFIIKESYESEGIEESVGIEDETATTKIENWITGRMMKISHKNKKIKWRPENEVSLDGIILAADFTENGKSISYVLLTDDEDEYQLEPKWSGQYLRLDRFERKKVKAHGEIKTIDHQKILYVNDLATEIK